MFIRQISVFLENSVGELRQLTELLGKNGIDLMGISIADTQNFGIVRLIVRGDKVDDALKLLRDNLYTARVNHVICAEVADRPMGLCELLTLIEQAGLSVEYMYSFLRGSGQNYAHMIMRLSDGEKAMQLFEMHNVRVLSQDEVDAL